MSDGATVNWPRVLEWAWKNASKRDLLLCYTAAIGGVMTFSNIERVKRVVEKAHGL